MYSQNKRRKADLQIFASKFFLFLPQDLALTFQNVVILTGFF